MTFAEETHILQPQQRERVRQGHALEFLVDYFARESQGGRQGTYLDSDIVRHSLAQRHFLSWYGHDAYSVLHTSSISHLYSIMTDGELSHYFQLLFHRRCRKTNRGFQYKDGSFSFEDLHLESDKDSKRFVHPSIIYKP